MGLSVFAGEAEGRLDEVLRMLMSGQLKPLYNYMNDLPGIDGAPLPLLKRERVKRTVGATTSFDAGRGCPYQCSFCTIINVQGRKSRRRTRTTSRISFAAMRRKACSDFSSRTITSLATRTGRSFSIA